MGADELARLRALADAYSELMTTGVNRMSETLWRETALSAGHRVALGVPALLAEVERLREVEDRALHYTRRTADLTEVAVEQEKKLARCEAWIEKAAEAMRGIGPGNHAPSCPCEVCGLARLADTRPRGLLERTT